MNHLTQKSPKKATARRYVVGVLTQEILSNPEPKDFLIASEHQFSRRFAVSRVTIRLALMDLEHSGLIYRRHGKGTFAYGRSTRAHRSLGVLIKSPDALKQASVIEIIRGVQAVIAPFHSSLVLISASPLEWHTEMASSLAGVIVFPQDVTAEELDMFKQCNLPFLCFQESHLSIGDNDFFNLGQRAALALNQASTTREPVGEIRLDLTTADLNNPGLDHVS